MPIGADSQNPASTQAQLRPGLAGPPTEGTLVPSLVTEALEGVGVGNAHLVPVWENEAGGLTFSVARRGAEHPADLYVKWNPATSGESLATETERLRWLQGRHPAPRVVDLVTNADEEVLITHALPGQSAVSKRWREEPETALRALGRGLRLLHELPTANCPYDWGVESRKSIKDTPPSVLGQAPPIDKLVVCHGDPCAPNTLIGEGGQFLAHVDMGRLGLADRWADLAVITMSLEWNYPRYDEATFWSSYDLTPDRERIEYYRLLWDAE